MNLPDAWRQFFLKTEEGKEFINKVEAMIEANHEKAENTPENARDYSQKAVGNREVLNLITSTTTITKKDRPM